MALETEDIILTDDEVTILNGDFVVKDSDQQHIEHLLKARPGHFYQYPLIGLGIETQFNGSISPQRLKQDIKLMLRADNYRPTLVNVTNEYKIFIDAKRLK